MGKEILKNHRMMTKFILSLRILPDTPALIRFVTADEDYLLLCSCIVNDTKDRSPELEPLKDICRKNELDFHVLKEKLTPVAQAFGLVEDESDYYELLGVPRGADTGEIKKAFRNKVIRVHPDTGDPLSASGREFINLQSAYRILIDPLLRQQYDNNLGDLNLWKEKANHLRGIAESGRLTPLTSSKPKPNSSEKAKIYYQLGGLFLILIIAVFIFDFLYRQNSIFDSDNTLRQKQIQKQKPIEAPVQAASDRNTAKSSPNLRTSPYPADNSSSNFKSDAIFKRGTKEQRTD